jgi:hypothetical protein
MAPKPSHVAKLIVEAGGLDVVFPGDCQAALLACGISPNSFDAYTKRASAEKRARAELGGKEAAATADALKKAGPEQYLTANSQSGHMAQNALLQGKRDLPCTNIPPNDADPKKATDGGSYGYEMGTAPCTDHFGGSTEAGTTHDAITKLEAKRAATMRADDPTKRLDQAELKDCVRDTAKVAAKGADPKGGTARAQTLSDAQAAAAKKGQNPANPAKNKPSAKTINKAADCMADAWEKLINAQREQCIAQHSTEAKVNRDKKNKDKTSKERQKIIDKKKADLDKKLSEPEFQKKVKDRDESLSKSSKDCLEQQANWLKAYKDERGKLPPVAGRVPGTNETDGSGGGGDGGTNMN